MLAYALSSNTWWAVAFLTAVSVLTILGMMAKILSYELLLIKVVSSARNMRTKIQQSIDEVEQDKLQQATDASQALKDINAANAEDQEQEDYESSSDEISAHTTAPDSPDDISSNIDVSVPVEESDNVEAAAA